MDTWDNKHVLILGAARQGQALARWMVRHGARVTLSDARDKASLATSLEALADLPVEWALGGHPPELLRNTDLLCLSGGVPVTIPIVVEAKKQGIPLSNDTQIFMELAPCRTVGITGSSGKSTTTMLVGKMAETAYAEKPGRSWIGGNIGDPLINYVDEMEPEDLAILEISSFQLELMSISPQIAVILNVTPNHLDRHETMEAYTKAKARILDFQTKQDIAILGRDNPVAWSLRKRVNGKYYSFGLSPLGDDQSGTYASEGLYHLRDENAYILLPIQNAIHLRGQHNLMNILAAVLIGYAAGISLDSMLEAIDGFHGIPHRLELVREHKGVKWFNDSIATAPERSIAAIRSFDEPIILLLGGRDKHLPWGDLAKLVRQRVDHLIVFGEAAGKIIDALGTPGSEERPYSIRTCAGLREAIQSVAGIAKAGDVVLFSPGGTSFDEFRDFAERGDKFRAWVQDLS
jgi:UDP-N-acetylmuramoylalanine--D-glutamate ligase